MCDLPADYPIHISAASSHSLAGTTATVLFILHYLPVKHSVHNPPVCGISSMKTPTVWKQLCGHVWPPRWLPHPYISRRSTSISSVLGTGMIPLWRSKLSSSDDTMISNPSTCFNWRILCTSRLTLPNGKPSETNIYIHKRYLACPPQIHGKMEVYKWGNPLSVWTGEKGVHRYLWCVWLSSV